MTSIIASASCPTGSATSSPSVTSKSTKRLEGATFQIEDARRWVYLKHVYEDERLIEARFAISPLDRVSICGRPRHLRALAELPLQPDSSLATRAGDAYRAAIEGQVAVCEEVFARPLSVVSGAAGTGKTTVINALLQAIERSDGRGATFQLLAPTGKAAERLRDATDKRYPTATIHSFLAQNAWLNDNLTFRRHGGRREDSVTTIVVDEASMLSLDLLATLLRAVQWKAVRRRFWSAIRTAAADRSRESIRRCDRLAHRRGRRQRGDSPDEHPSDGESRARTRPHFSTLRVLSYAARRGREG